MSTRSASRLPLFAVLLSAFGMVEDVRAADRFVSIQGDDTANTCLTSSAPCLTIGHAVAQAASGDVINTVSGRYDESLLIDASVVLTLSGSWEPDFGSRDATARATKLLGPIQVEAGLGEVIDLTVDGFRLTRESGIVAESSDDGALSVTLVNSGVDRNRTNPAITAQSADTSTLTLDLTDSTVASNRVLTGDAAIYLSCSGTSQLTVAMTDAAVEKNFASQYGTWGIIAYVGAGFDMTLTRTRFVRNTGATFTIVPFGGAVPNLTLTDVTVTRNTGGIGLEAGTVTITNSVIAKNRGIGVHLAPPGPNSLTMVNSTVRGNRFLTCDDCGAGITVDSGSVDLLNTIVWGNRTITGPANDMLIAGGAIVNVDHSDVGDVSGTYNDLGGNINVDPLCVSRRDVHLTASSPVIDAGTCTGAPATDFDGDPRPTGAGCDMGADEFVP